MESKIDLTDRLRREGRWEEASRYKDAIVKELKASGEKRGEANQVAWLKMSEKYPPIEIEMPEILEDESVEVFSAEEIAGLPHGSLKNFSADVYWVYHNLDETPDISAVPCAGALGLLLWARKNRDEFFGKLLPKALQMFEEVPDSPEKAKQDNLAPTKSLEERIGYLVNRQ